jgi:hypothetical protein
MGKVEPPLGGFLKADSRARVLKVCLEQSGILTGQMMAESHSHRLRMTGLPKKDYIIYACLPKQGARLKLRLNDSVSTRESRQSNEGLEIDHRANILSTPSSIPPF